MDVKWRRTYLASKLYTSFILVRTSRSGKSSVMYSFPIMSLWASHSCGFGPGLPLSLLQAITLDIACIAGNASLQIKIQLPDVTCSKVRRRPPTIIEASVGDDIHEV